MKVVVIKVYSKYVTIVDSLPNSEDTMREVFTEVLLLEWRTVEQIKNFHGKKQEKDIHGNTTRILQHSISFHFVLFCCFFFFGFRFYIYMLILKIQASEL